MLIAEFYPTPIVLRGWFCCCTYTILEDSEMVRERMYQWIRDHHLIVINIDNLDYSPSPDEQKQFGKICISKGYFRLCYQTMDYHTFPV